MMLQASVLRTAPVPAPADGRIARALNWIEVKLWYYLHVWLDLASMQHMTGEDGLPAFWKVAFTYNTAVFTYVVHNVHLEGSTSASLPWLFAWAALSYFAGHSLKGLQIYGKYMGANNTTSAHMEAKVDLAAMIKEVAAARTNGLYQESL